MNVGATLLASFLVTLVRRSTWPLALGAFLLRGGLLLVIAPIIVIPSAVGTANLVGPLLTSFVFGGATPSVVAAAAIGGIAAVTWLLGGGFLAAALEAEMIRIVATDEETYEAAVAAAPEQARRSGRGPMDTGWRGASRILVVRLIALAPLGLAVVWGGARIVDATYGELTLPSDTSVPVAVRVVQRTPEALLVIGLAWWLSQVVGTVAARRVVVAGRGVARSLASAVSWLLRHPLRAVAFEIAPSALFLGVAIAAAAASASAWQAVRASFAGSAGPAATIALVVAFVALWSGGVLLIGVVAAWRGAVWTVDAAGTFGASRAAESGTGRDAATLPR